MSMYALQVMTGMEAEITQKLRGKGVDARCPQERRMIRRGGKWQEQLYTLFPSYIFVSTPDVYRVYYAVRHEDGVLHWLGATKGTPEALSAHEEANILWLAGDGPLPPSEAEMQADGTLDFTSGPLAHLKDISFNPPAASRNWANRYAREERKGKRVHHSTYLQAPAAWLGPKFLAQAEYIKETQPTKYRHEYLGEVVGSGTQVFENLRLEPISQKTIRNFDTIENGVDWGWYPDPWAFNRCHYDAAHKTLYIFDELTRLRTSNEETAKLVQQRIESWESVTADSAEMKSCADYRAFGILCREAVKGPGSVNQSMKWLQGLAAIVIDPHRCPDTAKEFSEYEYEVGRDGTVLPGYVDADNHHIDAVRYAVNRIWMRRGA